MAAVINVLALPLYLRDVVFLGRIDSDSPLGGVEHGAWVALGVMSSSSSRSRDPAAPLPLGRAMTAPSPRAEPAARRSGVRAGGHRRGGRRVGLVRAEGRPLGAELLVRAGRDRTARPQRRRQDHADAVDDGTGARQPGHHPRRRPRTPAETAVSTAGWRSCRRTRRCRPGSRLASSCATSPTSTA